MERDSHVASTIAARTRLKETTVRRRVDDLVALVVLDLVRIRPDRVAGFRLAAIWLGHSDLKRKEPRRKSSDP
jgi:DNA-binding Lrp family transcriptional regulator